MFSTIAHFIMAHIDAISHLASIGAGAYLYASKDKHPITDAALRLAGFLLESIHIRPKPKNDAYVPPDKIEDKNNSSENQ